MRFWLIPTSILAMALIPIQRWENGILLPHPRTAIRLESFDRDPHWDGKNNRVAPRHPNAVRQNFGYVPGSMPGSAGRIGGEVWRSVKPAYYGKPVGPYTMNDRLQCAGKLSLVKASATVGWQSGSTIFVGFFGPSAQEWRPLNFIGFRLEGFNEPDGVTVELCYGTRAWTAGGVFVNAEGGAQERNVRDLDTRKLLRIAPDRALHDWSLAYDPGAGDGSSRLLFTFDGNVTKLNVARVHREQGATLNRFGLFNCQIPGYNMTAFLSDLVINDQKQDLSRDPGWDGMGNRARYRDRVSYGANDFGFSLTRFAGGQPGELGGRFFSCDPHEHQFKGYYGDGIGKLTLDDRLFATGRFAARHFSVDSSFALGWFNSREQGWPIKNFVGVYFDSLTSVGRIVQPLYGSARGNERDRRAPYLQFVPDGTSYRWSLAYEPEAEGATLSFTLEQKAVVVRVPQKDKATGATLDRFGVFNMQWANSKWCEVYLDDLEYTTETR